jgi:hypothetical protein
VGLRGANVAGCELVRKRTAGSGSPF